jgi:hypothetical protein
MEGGRHDIVRFDAIDLHEDAPTGGRGGLVGTVTLDLTLDERTVAWQGKKFYAGFRNNAMFFTWLVI